MLYGVVAGELAEVAQLVNQCHASAHASAQLICDLGSKAAGQQQGPDRDIANSIVFGRNDGGPTGLMAFFGGVVMSWWPLRVNVNLSSDVVGDGRALEGGGRWEVEIERENGTEEINTTAGTLSLDLA